MSNNRRRKYSSSDSSEVDSDEERRKRDLKDRDEFSERLKKKVRSNIFTKKTSVSKLCFISG